MSLQSTCLITDSLNTHLLTCTVPGTVPRAGDTVEPHGLTMRKTWWEPPSSWELQLYVPDMQGDEA